MSHLPHIPHLPRRHDPAADRTIIARREVITGRGKDVMIHWLELRHTEGRFRIFTGGRWSDRRGSERIVHSSTSLREAVTYANRRIRGLNARHGAERRPAEELRLIEVRRICDERGLLLDPNEHIPELEVVELSDTLFA